jgi:phenylacetate-CoA ligase
MICAMANQLLANEWRGADQIRARQLGQLRAMLQHAAHHVPLYAERIRRCGLDPACMESLDDLRRLPLLERADLQDHHDDIRARRLPRGIKLSASMATSGASGSPVRVLGTNLSGLMWAACNLRSYVWAGINPGGRLAAIRFLDAKTLSKAHSPGGAVLENWGGSSAQCFVTGPCHAMHIDQDMDRQVAFVEKADPDYLLSYPSDLALLGSSLRERDIVLKRLQVVQTVSEVLSEEVRREIEEGFGAPVFDVYSCVEVGYIASDCPSGHGYHVHQENVLVELLDERGEPCPPGQVGRVVVTALTNYGFPLIRYDVGDYAEAAEPGPCPCGRGLMRLARVVGRQRGQLLAEDGTAKFGHPISVACRDAGMIRQFQVVQHERDRIEVRIVPMDGFGEVQERTIADAIHAHLGAGMSVSFTRVAKIDRAPGGKYLDFICKVR